MTSRYIVQFMPSRLALAATLASVLFVTVELSVAREFSQRRLARDLEFLTTTCQPTLGGQPIVSSILSIAPYENRIVPSRLTCVYAAAPQYGKALKRTTHRNQ